MGVPILLDGWIKAFRYPRYRAHELLRFEAFSSPKDLVFSFLMSKRFYSKSHDSGDKTESVESNIDKIATRLLEKEAKIDFLFY